MNKLRRWLLKPADPFALPLAADARLRETDYLDDQVWRLSLGTGSSPALALQTQYGGRVGLASLIPMWTHNNRIIYEAQSYAEQPVIQGFAPGYLRVHASVLPGLTLRAEYWSIDSHTLGALFTFNNEQSQPVEIRLDVFGHVGAQGKEQPLSIVPIDNQTHALHMGNVGNLNPLVLVEAGRAELVDGEAISPKIGRTLAIAPGKKVTVRWVHVGLANAGDSLAQAQHWLKQDWSPELRRIYTAAQALPAIATDDNDLDATLATAYNQLVLSFLRPAGSLPHASFVALRDTGTGFSRNRDGSDYPRAWDGQAPHLAYLAALGIAPVDAQLAQGIIRNYLAVQQDDGWIDWKPGLAGQKQGLLCLPILARLTWGIFQYTEDDTFLREAYPALVKFFECWLRQDADGDGLPEWHSEIQTGYVYWPAFSTGQAWAESTDIRTVETPDLLAYLLSEAVSLRAIAFYLRDSASESALQQHVETLQGALESLWNGERYIYRDRDTHQTGAGVTVLDDVRGDEEHILALPLDPPARLNIRIQGGIDHTPRFTLRLDGLDSDGAEVHLTTDQKNFIWQRNRGMYTTAQVFSQVDRIQFEGLSRVYKLSVTTPDTSHLDLNALLPLWSVGVPHNDALITLLTDSDQFWRSSGASMVPAQAAHFDPTNANGAGGVWPYWLTLMGEGLIEAGRLDLATELLRRLLSVQTAVLKAGKNFTEFYHADAPQGLGTPGHLAGIVPLHLLLRVLGIRIISASKVWTGGPYHWPAAITFRQHGVTVRRSSEGTSVKFASGHETTLAAGEDWHEIIDPTG